MLAFRPASLLAFAIAPFLAAPALPADLTSTLPEARPDASCMLELSAFDAAGNPVLQAPAFALPRPGILIAPLHVLERPGIRWDRLRAAFDPAGTADPAQGTSFEVTEGLEARVDIDLAVLRAPGLRGCTSGEAVAVGGSAERHPFLSAGRRLYGMRERSGYRSRVFGAIVERPFEIPGGPPLALVKVTDGGGAEAGFLLDRTNRLVGSILPSLPVGDRSLAGVAVFEADELARSALGSGRPLRDLLPPGSGPGFAATSPGLFIQSLQLTRDDQADRALELLEEAARKSEPFPELLVARGVLKFRSGRIEEAVADFSRAAQADSRSHLAYYNLGIALGTLGRYTAACQALEKAIEIDPQHPRSHFQLALAFKAAKLPGRARGEFDLLGRLDPALAGELGSLLGF